MKILIDIQNCSECKFCKVERVYTADSFERPDKWTCQKSNKIISSYVEWNDKIDIPDWCEILQK